MSDANTTPDLPKAPEVKREDVVAGGEKPVFAGTITPEQQAILNAHEKAKSIEDARKEHPGSPLEVLGKITDVPEYTKDDLKLTVDALGSGATQLKTTMEPIAQYLEAVKRSKRNGTELTTELRGNAVGIQEAVGKLLVDRGGLYEKFPYLKTAFASETDLYKYIEQNMARDPIFQREIVTTLNEIKTKAEAIKKTGSNAEDLTKAKEGKDNLDKLQTSIKTRIEATLSAQGFTPDQITQMSTYIDLGDTPENVLRQARSIARANKNVDPALEKYSANFAASEDVGREIQELENQLTNERANINTKNQAPNRPQEIQRLEALKKQAENRRDAAERNKTALKDSYIARFPDANGNPMTDSEFVAKHQDYLAITAVFDTESPLLADFTVAIENQAKIKELGERIKQLGSNPEIATSENEKTEAIRQLEGVIDTAMAGFLTKRFHERTTDSDILLEASSKRAEKDGKIWKAGGIKSVKAVMDGWGKFDKKSREFKYDKTRIASTLGKLTELSADGSDGGRKFFADTVGYELDPKKFKDKIASEILDSSTTYESLTDAQKLDADTRMQQRTQDFESIYAEHSENFNKRLFESYFASKGFMDKIGQGKLSLTDDEAKILTKQFGSFMDNELESSGLMKALREKGIVPDSKLKLFLFLLAILGIGAVATVGIAPAALAAASAAKGVGAAAWSEGVV